MIKMKGGKGMAQKYKKDKKQNSILQGIGKGILISVVVSLAVSAIMSIALVNGTVDTTVLDFGVLGILAISSLLGCVAALFGAEEKCAIIMGVTIIAYSSVLIMLGVLFFESGFEKVLSRIIVISISGGFGGVIAMRKKTGNRGIRNRSR